jgi:hypothetical protein
MVRALTTQPLITVELEPTPVDWVAKVRSSMATAELPESDLTSMASLDILYTATAKLRKQFGLELLGYDFNEYEVWLKFGNQYGCVKLNAQRWRRRLVTEVLSFGRSAHDGAELLEWASSWSEPQALADFANGPLTKARITRAAAIPKHLRSHRDNVALMKSVEHTCAIIGELASSVFQARSPDAAHVSGL